MKQTLYFTILVPLCFILTTFVCAQEKAILVVKPKAKGAKGTLCELFDHSGNTTDSKVIVRGFFATPEQFSQKLNVFVTVSQETLRLNGIETPIFHLIPDQPPTPFDGKSPEAIIAAGDTVITVKDQFFIIDEQAALKFPAKWSVTENLTPPLFLAAEQNDLQIGLSLLKENPEELEVETLDEYAKLKTDLLKEKFPDFKPSSPKAGKIGELPAMFFQGPGTINNINGTITGMAIEGKTHFYLLFGMSSIRSPGNANTELLKVMKSFKEKK